MMQTKMSVAALSCMCMNLLCKLKERHTNKFYKT